MGSTSVMKACLRSTTGIAAMFVGACMLWLAADAGAQVFAQAPPGSESTEAADVSDLLMSARARVASSIELTHQISDVTNFRKGDETNPFVPNTNKNLWKTTAKIKVASMFLTPAEISAAYKALPDYRDGLGLARTTADPLGNVPPQSLLDYFSRTRPVDRFGRFLSAFTLSGSLLERADTDFGDMPPTDVGDRTKWSADLTFDPASLFVTPAERKAAFEGLAAYLKVHADKANHAAILPCQSRRACLDGIAGLRGVKAYLASLIPTIKVESIDEFDYAVVGGQAILFPPDGRDRALQSYSFTWNALKIIRPSASRITAIEALTALKDLETTRNTVQKALLIDTRPIPLRLGVFQAHQLGITSGDKGSLTWARGKEDARNLAGMYLTEDGVLIGQPVCPPNQTSCTADMNVSVTDSQRRKHEAVIRLDIN